MLQFWSHGRIKLHLKYFFFFVWRLIFYLFIFFLGWLLFGLFCKSYKKLLPNHFLLLNLNKFILKLWEKRNLFFFLIMLSFVTCDCGNRIPTLVYINIITQYSQRILITEQQLQSMLTVYSPKTVPFDAVSSILLLHLCQMVRSGKPK